MTEISIIKKIPKIELHLHLDGCIKVETAFQMLKEQSGLAEKYRSLSLSQLKKVMVIEKPLRSQKELLEFFDVPGVVLQTKEHLRQAYYELCEMKSSDNVCYCEVRFAPQLHIAAGLTIDEVMEAVLEGKVQGEKEFGIQTNLIVVGLKDRSSEDNIQMLEIIKKYADRGVAAVDCAGIEDIGSVSRQEAFLLKAKEYGFPVTFHCGEIPESLNELETMVHRIGPNRIAHGAIASQNRQLCEVLAEKQIMLEVCPTSNIQAGLYKDYENVPVRQLYERSVPISINTDDTVLSDITLSQELSYMMESQRFSLSQICELNAKALEHSFADEETKKE